MITLVKFTMHDGKEITVEVDNYSASSIKKILNDRAEEYVSFNENSGGFSRQAVKYWDIVKEPVQ